MHATRATEHVLILWQLLYRLGYNVSHNAEDQLAELYKTIGIAENSAAAKEFVRDFEKSISTALNECGIALKKADDPDLPTKIILTLREAGVLTHFSEGTPHSRAAISAEEVLILSRILQRLGHDSPAQYERTVEDWLAASYEAASLNHRSTAPALQKVSMQHTSRQGVRRFENAMSEALDKHMGIVKEL